MLNESDFKNQEILSIAKRMAIAARTAPKGRGRNTIETVIAFGNDLELIAKQMEDYGQKSGQQFFLRDANNIRNSAAVLFIGTEISPLGLKSCGICGMTDCENKNKFPEVPCAFNTLDLGIAIGSAVSLAADSRVDNRVMFSAGMALREMKIFEEKFRIILAISLSANSKSIYFDRQ